MNVRSVLIAIGGNSLIQDKDHQTVEDQYVAAAETCGHIADAIVDGWRVVVTHGNGPQVGFILLRSELSRHALHEVPLVSCGADTQGALGWQIQMALGNALRDRGRAADVATVVTQCVVDRADPSFLAPSKPIGSFYSREDADRFRVERGWTMVEDAGRGWRRVVPSPKPLEVVEVPVIRALLERGTMVVAAGGGGIPVIRDDAGRLTGIDAVIDKDLASSLLATELGVDVLLISTAVPGVFVDFNRPGQRMLGRVSADDLRTFHAQGHFAKGSMAPKVEAVLGFLARGGREAIITDPAHVSAALRGEAGTRVHG